MLRVYLDTNKWVDLARAHVGHPEGKRFEEVAAVIAAAVERGLASFPLSTGNWFEVWKQHRATRRHDLARTMSAVSRNHTIASPHALVAGELEQALQRRFGRPATLTPIAPFGFGTEHLFGGGLPKLSPLVRAAFAHANPALGSQGIDRAIDAAILAGPNADLPAGGIQQPPLQFAQDFADGEARQAAIFAEHGADKDTRRRAIAARIMVDVREALSEALARAGLRVEDLAALGPKEGVEFVLDLPTRAAGLELLCRQHDNPQTVWEANDMADIGFLSTAVAYCDIVVTERKWTAMLNQSGAATRAGTTVTDDLTDLVELLVADSAAA